jgi:hypothetical protein
LFTAMFDPRYKNSVGWALVNIPVILTTNLGTLSFHGFECLWTFMTRLSTCVFF